MGLEGGKMGMLIRTYMEMEGADIKPYYLADP